MSLIVPHSELIARNVCKQLSQKIPCSKNVLDLGFYITSPDQRHLKITSNILNCRHSFPLIDVGISRPSQTSCIVCILVTSPPRTTTILNLSSTALTHWRSFMPALWRPRWPFGSSYQSASLSQAAVGAWRLPLCRRPLRRRHYLRSAAASAAATGRRVVDAEGRQIHRHPRLLSPL